MSIRDKFVLGKRFFIEDIEPAVSENGFRRICDLLYPKYGINIPVTFDHRWMVKDSKEEFQGSFPKRLASLLHKEYEVDITMSDKERIGSAAKVHCFSRSRYEYEFTDNLAWESGDFGDSGSCYWSGHSFARAMMIHNGSLAILFYDKGKGWGRAWIHFSDIHKDCLFISNAYPKAFALDQVALILARHFEMSYKPIKLHNNGIWDGTLHINNGRGIALFKEDHEFVSDTFDLHFDSEYVKCSKCGRLTGAEYTYISKKGFLFCIRCREALFFECVKCRKTKDMSESADERIEGSIVCQSCEKTIAACHECGERRFEITDKGLCETCHRRKYVGCNHCGKEVDRKGASGYDGYKYCDQCYGILFIACTDCGEMTSKRDFRRIYRSENYVCQKCLRKYIGCRFCGLHKRNERCACRPKDKGVQEGVPKKSGVALIETTGIETTGIFQPPTVDFSRYRSVNNHHIGVQIGVELTTGHYITPDRHGDDIPF